MRSRKLVLLALVLAFTMALPGNSQAGFFSKLLQKILPLRVRIVLGLVYNSDLGEIIRKTQDMYTFPQVEGLQTFKAQMLEIPGRQAQEMQKQKSIVKYKTSPDGGDCKIDMEGLGSVNKKTQQGMLQGTNKAGAKEFAKLLFPPSLDQEKTTNPNVQVKSKPMFPFGFFCNDVQLIFRPYSQKKYDWKIDSAQEAKGKASDGLGLAGDNVGQAQDGIGGIQSGMQGLQDQLGGLGGSSNPLQSIMQFLQMGSSLLSQFQSGAGGIQGMLQSALGQVTQAQQKIQQAQSMIAEGKGKISEISNQLGNVGGGASGVAQQIQSAMAKLNEAGTGATELLGKINGLADKIQGLGSQASSKIQDFIGEATGMQGQLSQVMNILNMIMSLLGGGSGGVASGLQSLMQGLGASGDSLSAITDIMNTATNAGDTGGSNEYGDAKKIYVINPLFMIRAIQSQSAGSGPGSNNGSWAYVFSTPTVSSGRTRLQQYCWLGVKYYYFPFPESITIRGTKSVAGFSVPRHILNVNWDSTDFPPLKVKLIFFKGQQVNIPLSMTDQQTEEETPVDDPNQQQKDRDKAYEDLKDAAEQVRDNTMAAGHILAASRIAALAAAADCYQSIADAVDDMEEVVKDTVVTETASTDAGRAAEGFMAEAAGAAKSIIDQLIAAVPVKTEGKTITVGPLDPNKLKAILKAICPPIRKAASSAARAMEGLVASTDAQATRRFSEIKFNLIQEWAIRALAQANLANATSEAKVALRACKIAQAFAAQSKKDAGQIGLMTSSARLEATRAVKALDAAVAGSGPFRPVLTLEQRVLVQAEDAKTNTASSTDNKEEIEVFGEYDPYDHDNSDGSSAETTRGPFSSQAADLASQALNLANQIANAVRLPRGEDVISDIAPNTETLKKVFQLVAEQVKKLNIIRRLEGLATTVERNAVQQTANRQAAVRSLIGAYAALSDPAKQKAKDLLMQAANIGNDPTIITEEWTKPGTFKGDNVYASTGLKKLNLQQLAQLVASAQAKAAFLAARAKELADKATKKESQAFIIENRFIGRLLGSILRRAARAHARAARAFAIATTLCGASFSEQRTAETAANQADQTADQADSAASDVNNSLNQADKAQGDAHQARIDALIALVDQQLAEDDLARITDVLINKTKKEGGTQTPGTGNGTNNGGSDSNVTKDIIKAIQDAMNDGDLKKLIELLKKLIKERGLGDKIGRLAQQLLDEILSDANRGVEDGRESARSDNNETIFTARDLIDLISSLLNGTPVDASATDLRDNGLGSVGGSGKGDNRFNLARAANAGTPIGTDRGGNGSVVGSGSGGSGGSGGSSGGFSSSGSVFGKKGSGSGGSGSAAETADPNVDKEAERIFTLAQQKEKDGQIAEAVKLYDTVVKNFPKSSFADPSNDRIRALMGDPNSKKTIDDGAAVFFERGKALLDKGDEKGALGMFNTVVNDFPTSTQAPDAQKLIDQLLGTGGSATAIGGTAGGTTTGGGGVPSGLARDPQGKIDEAAQLFADAQQFEKDGAFEDAIKNYNTIVTTFSESGFAKPSQERLNALLGDPKIKDALEDKAAVLMSRGASMLEAGNLAGALQMFNTLIADFPTSRYANEAKGKVADIESKMQSGGGK